MGKIWAQVCGMVDEVALFVGNNLGAARPMSKTPFVAPPSRERLRAELDANPPRVLWPNMPRVKGRVRIELPTLGTHSFCDMLPSRSPDADTLVVYHHGLGELPHSLLARLVRRHKVLRDRVDLVALKQVHHQNPSSVCRLVSHRDYFARAIAAQSATADVIATTLGERYRYLIMMGVSMGGMITLGAAAVSKAFDAYLPIVAGPDLGDLLFHSSFGRYVPSQHRRQEMHAPWAGWHSITPMLTDPRGAPICALLGRYDRLFRLQPQLRAYKHVPRASVRVIDSGHVLAPGTISPMALHLSEVLEKDVWCHSDKHLKLRREPDVVWSYGEIDRRVSETVPRSRSVRSAAQERQQVA